MELIRWIGVFICVIIEIYLIGQIIKMWRKPVNKVVGGTVIVRYSPVIISKDTSYKMIIIASSLSRWK